MFLSRSIGISYSRQAHELRARYLNPNIGRFWTMDSYEGNTEEPISLHKYLYCSANPANRLDPDGKDDFDVLLGIADIYAGLFKQPSPTYGPIVADLFLSVLSAKLASC